MKTTQSIEQIADDAAAEAYQNKKDGTDDHVASDMLRDEAKNVRTGFMNGPFTAHDLALSLNVGDDEARGFIRFARARQFIQSAGFETRPPGTKGKAAERFVFSDTPEGKKMRELLFALPVPAVDVAEVPQ